VDTAATTQNGGEAKTVAAFSPDLLTGIKYFGNRLCPFAHRAFLTLEEKGLLSDGTVEYIHINLGPSKPEWYKVC
jgi:hypothetical protein